MKPIPATFLGDDATSADQIALGIVEILGLAVVTIDAEMLSRADRPGDGCVRVINTRARALPAEQADALNQLLARQIPLADRTPPVLQIDSRLRGIRNAVRGLYKALDFDLLLFVPAEPSLDRLVRDGIFCHVENSQLVPFLESELASATAPLPCSSDLREVIAAELDVPAERILCIGEAIVSQGPEAILDFVRRREGQPRTILVPDVTRPEHFDAVVQATGSLDARVLIAGSRTFLRSLFGCYRTGSLEMESMSSLAQAIDKSRRGAPVAIVSSLEPAMNSQVEYACRAIGPNLVTIGFDSSVVLKDEPAARGEIDRVRQLVLQSLQAMRPVLLHTSRTAVFTDAAVQQKHLDALSVVLTDERIVRLLTALFVSGGQTAETIKKALGIASVEIKGAFQKSIPWSVPLEGALKGVPLVTKGGRMGDPNVLYEFLEQGHPLPRANVLPVVTPLTKTKEVDEAGIERLIAHLVRLGTTDVFAVGNAGEFRFLRNEQRLQAIEVFARKARGRLRVFAGITGDTADETRQNYAAVARLGVHAAVVMPLYFLSSSDQIVPFVESLPATEPRLPLILYNNPERTNKQHISFEAVEALRFPVVAIKDSSGDLERFDCYARSMIVYEGQQRQFLEGYEHGARGAIGIIGHVSSLPNEFFAPTTTAERRKEIAGLINDLSKVVKQGGAEVAAYKYLLSLMGVIGDTVASNEPARELTPEQRDLIRTNNAELISRMRMSS